MIRALGLEELIPDVNVLRNPMIIKARVVFVVVALWVALLLALSHYVIQSVTLKISLVMASWALFPIGARAVASNNIRSIQYECFVAVWKLFYLAFLLPRLASYGIALLNSI